MKSLHRLLPLIGLALFAWIIHRTGIENIRAAFSHFNYRWLLALPFLITIFLYTKAKKWQWILRAYGIHYPLMKCAKAFLVGFFAALITPAKIGDGMRVAYLRRDTHTPVAVGLSTLFIDRLCDLLASIILVIVSIVLFWIYFDGGEFAPVIVAACAFVIIIAAATTNETIIRRMFRPFFVWWVPDRYKEQVRHAFRSFYSTMTAAGQKKMLIARAFAINLISWGVTVADFYVIAHALGIPMTVVQVFAIAPLVVIAEILPVSISGLGTREAALLFLFAHAGLPAAMAVPYSLAFLVLGAWTYGTLGLAVWLKHPVAFTKAAPHHAT